MEISETQTSDCLSRGNPGHLQGERSQAVFRVPNGMSQQKVRHSEGTRGPRHDGVVVVVVVGSGTLIFQFCFVYGKQCPRTALLNLW